MSNLLIEIALRLSKVGLAAVVGLLIYAVIVGPLGATGSAELALLAFVCGSAIVLLLESSPL